MKIKTKILIQIQTLLLNFFSMKMKGGENRKNNDLKQTFKVSQFLNLFYLLIKKKRIK